MQIFRIQLITLIFVVLQCTFAQAQITTDGSLGGAAVPLKGPDFAITASLGSIKGNNLFHSFSEFNLASVKSATFSGPESIANILSRVTGGTASKIDGTLRLTIDGANLFLLNPHGVFLSKNARVDVSGTFVVSTADYLKLGQDGVLNGSLGSTDTLTTAPPSAFGFSGTDAGSISFAGNEIVVGDGQTLAAVGGDITIDSAEIKALGGQVSLLSAAFAGEAVLVDESGDLDHNRISSLGAVFVTDSSVVNVDGTGGGRIFIRGDQVLLAACRASISVN